MPFSPPDGLMTTVLWDSALTVIFSAQLFPVLEKGFDKNSLYVPAITVSVSPATRQEIPARIVLFAPDWVAA
jgi:hypothetical protein